MFCSSCVCPCGHCGPSKKNHLIHADPNFLLNSPWWVTHNDNGDSRPVCATDLLVRFIQFTPSWCSNPRLMVVVFLMLYKFTIWLDPRFLIEMCFSINSQFFHGEIPGSSLSYMSTSTNSFCSYVLVPEIMGKNREIIAFFSWDMFIAMAPNRSSNHFFLSSLLRF